MLLFTISFGGLLMMGRKAREESLFYYFKLEDQVPGVIAQHACHGDSE